MCQLDKLYALRSQINEIAKKHRVEKVYVFGSCARKEETPKSDLDVLADFSLSASLFDQCGLKVDLEDLLQCKVDVISKRALKDDVFANNVRRDMVEIC